jgi:hypothetical protein
VFAITFKVYSTLSSRRFHGDLLDACAQGYLSQPLHYNSVNGDLESAELTPILQQLLARSSLPLAAPESGSPSIPRASPAAAGGAGSTRRTGSAAPGTTG